jgi:hydroxymethylglutaryl-CoA reductase (NADPH)
MGMDYLYINRTDKESRIALANQLLKPFGVNSDVFKSHLSEEMVKGNIENFIGAVPVPLGLCGPIDIHGQFASGRFVVPMASQEGTLVASYSRGAKITGAPFANIRDFKIRGSTGPGFRNICVNGFHKQEG